ncbi:helix-turn-helix transcriptional regulator [Paractinoplanes globisporus]|uniref:AAA family ATPase n=1 Tax=Paractinoplanes globisporus TaxID=113565 RepID=A0ABW6W9I1_9ACTN|nr:LuxR family transcriptional regulator [Actinoplanes globisporus]
MSVGPDLYGRDDALRAVAELMAGGGSAVAVGDPGSGKSTLLRAAADLGRSRGRRVLSITPTPFERGLPFAGLAELVGQTPAGLDRHLPEPQRRALAVALRRTEADGREVDALAVPLAVGGLLTSLCESEPVALLVDDLQWLDQASAGSLGFALRRVVDDPRRLSLLVATRPDPYTGQDLIRSLPGPRREILLRPLDEAAIGLLLRERLGPRWTPPMSAGVARASGGNPLLALEIGRAMQDGVPGRQTHDPVFPMPPSLVELLRERVEKLPEDAREVLLLASAAGRLTLAQLRRIAEPAKLRAALETAADADVAVVSPESAITFTHPLLASAIYDAAAPADRRWAHRLLAERLDDPVERARHRATSITEPDETVAGELESAADVSRGRGALHLAGELLEAAALATPSEADTAAGFRRRLRAADTYIDAGDSLAAQAALDIATALATLAQQQAQMLVRRARLADYLVGARSLAEQAFRLAPSAGVVRAEILMTLSDYHRMAGDGRGALRLNGLAIAETEAIRRPDLQLEALNQRQATERHWGLGRPEETVREIERLAAASELEPSAAEWAWAHSFYAAWNDDAAERYTRDGIAHTIETGRYGDLSSLYICLVLVLIRRSRVRDAQAAVAEADGLGAWGTHAPQENMARILVKEYAGDLDGARELARDAVAKSRTSGLTYWRGGFLAQLGFIETSARNWPAALEPLRELAGIFAETEMVDLEQLLWAVDYADAALQTGATDEAEAAIAVLRRQAAAGRPEAEVAADRCQALVSAVRGDVDGAVTELRAIVDRPGTECPFEAARSRLALGQVYRRAGYKGMAVETLTAAADAFDELGVPRWAERARDEAGRSGLRPATGLLTATESRVAELVGSGRSNRETAAELFMSVKTVETNLTRIYRKLSVRTRTELANLLNRSDPDG